MSTDNGATWHPATRRGSWAYIWSARGAGAATTVRDRADEDTANVGADAAVTVNVGARTCPCTIWDAGATPAIPADPDNTGTEVGTKFRADVAGQVTAIRFCKGTADTGTHVGHLDSAPLRALRDGVDGVYRYGTGGGLPSNTFQATNDRVDVVFTPGD